MRQHRDRDIRKIIFNKKTFDYKNLERKCLEAKQYPIPHSAKKLQAKNQLPFFASKETFKNAH